MPTFLSPEHHLLSLSERFGKLFAKKYMNGQQEHGGRLWEKDGLSHAIEETLDLWAYLLTHQDQREEAVCWLRTLEARIGKQDELTLAIRLLVPPGQHD